MPGAPISARATIVWLASSTDAAGITGKYLFDCRPKEPSLAAHDDEAARRLWQVSEQLAGLAQPAG